MAFGVASALSPADAKYLTVADTSDTVDATNVTADQVEVLGLEGVAEGRGQMHVRPLGSCGTTCGTRDDAGSVK